MPAVTGFVFRALLVAGLLYLGLTEARSVYGYQGWSGVHTDFFGTIWEPNHQVLQGGNPYTNPSLGTDPASVYPPSGFLPYLPLAWLAPHLAVVVFQLLLLAAAMGTLLALRVREAERWALWLMSPLVVIPVLAANITPVVVLAIALLWRWRDRALLAGAALTVAIAIKLFAAPLLLWLVITRRRRAALIAAVAAPAVILVSWALIGLRGMREYPAVLRLASKAYGADGPFLQALARQVGYTAAVATGVAVLAAGVLVLLATRSSEVGALALTCFACLLLSPVCWIFYAGILIVPLAAARLKTTAWRTLAAYWIVSWWYTPLPYGSADLSIVNLMICLIVVGIIVRGRPESHESRAPVIAPDARLLVHQAN